jgi:hypothetical protein
LIALGPSGRTFPLPVFFPPEPTQHPNRELHADGFCCFFDDLDIIPCNSDLATIGSPS